MKAINNFLLLVLFSGACSSNKKAATIMKVSTHTVTRSDVLKGGTSFENAIIIKVEKESAGVAEEYKWLSESYPGYSTVRKTQTANGKKHYDIIKIKTRDGWEKEIYFDTTSFFGKW
jgi:ABC-type glycerol-3-phosphate transport system substrate-binding protein